MSEHEPFESAGDDTHAQLMEATFDALREHGYADLTIQRIGDEFPKSKSLVYQHYDGKDELLVAVLEFMLEQFESEVPAEGFEDAREHLETFFDHALPDDVDDERAEFAAAMTELRAQAPHDDAFSEQFTRTDRSLRDHVADIVRDGVEEGVFREVDPEQTAAFVTATVHGARNVRATTDDEEAVLAARRALHEYVEEHLVAGDAEH